MSENTGFDIWCGLDVGKQSHHACALDAAGRKVFDKPLPQDQTKLEDLFRSLSEHGRVLMIVDQPNTIGALPIAVARSMGIQIAYLPSLAMRRAAHLYPGNATTDARDAFIIADTARTLPHTLRHVDAGEETLAELKVQVGFDEEPRRRSDPVVEPDPRPTDPDPSRTGTRCGNPIDHQAVESLIVV